MGIKTVIFKVLWRFIFIYQYMHGSSTAHNKSSSHVIHHSYGCAEIGLPVLWITDIFKYENCVFSSDCVSFNTHFVFINYSTLHAAFISIFDKSQFFFHKNSFISHEIGSISLYLFSLHRFIISIMAWWIVATQRNQTKPNRKAASKQTHFNSVEI